MSIVWFHVKRQGILILWRIFTKQSIGELEANLAAPGSEKFCTEKIAMTFQNEHMVKIDQWEGQAESNKPMRW